MIKKVDMISSAMQTHNTNATHDDCDDADLCVLCVVNKGEWHSSIKKNRIYLDNDEMSL